MDKEEFEINSLKQIKIFSIASDTARKLWKRRLILMSFFILGISVGFYYEFQKQEYFQSNLHIKSKYLGLKDSQQIIRILNDRLQNNSETNNQVSLDGIKSVNVIVEDFSYDWMVKFQDLAMEYPKELKDWIKLQESVNLEVQFFNKEGYLSKLDSLIEYLEQVPYVVDKKNELKRNINDELEFYQSKIDNSDSLTVSEDSFFRIKIMALQNSLLELKNVSVLAITPIKNQNQLSIKNILLLALAFVFVGSLLISLFK